MQRTCIQTKKTNKQTNKSFNHLEFPQKRTDSKTKTTSLPVDHPTQAPTPPIPRWPVFPVVSLTSRLSSTFPKHALTPGEPQPELPKEPRSSRFPGRCGWSQWNRPKKGDDLGVKQRKTGVLIIICALSSKKTLIEFNLNLYSVWVAHTKPNATDCSGEEESTKTGWEPVV